MIKQRLTRIALGVALAAGTLGATLAGTAPASAQAWHGNGGYWDRYHHWHPNGWRDRWGHWHAYGYAPAPAPGYYAHGPRYYDRVHHYWRDNYGYWNGAGVYVRFHF